MSVGWTICKWILEVNFITDYNTIWKSTALLSLATWTLISRGQLLILISCQTWKNIFWEIQWKLRNSQSLGVVCVQTQEEKVDGDDFPRSQSAIILSSFRMAILNAPAPTQSSTKTKMLRGVAVVGVWTRDGPMQVLGTANLLWKAAGVQPNREALV